VLLATMTDGFARQIHYGAVDDPALQACDELDWAGEKQAAQQCYRDLLQQTTNPAIQAEISWALGDIRTANSLFQSAVKMQADNAGVRLRWAELFMQTYQYQDALDLFNEALELDPDNAFARVGASRALANRFEAEAMDYLEPVLKSNAAPAGASLQARLLLARMAIENTDMDRAFEILAQADAIAGRHGLPKLEIYALYATMELLESNTGSAWIDKALEENPVYGDIYAIPGYFFWINRRYREAAALFKKAVDIQPQHWVAHMELGINLLRNNEVSLARKHLETAYSGDPYNPKTVNTLRLLDTFVDYDLINSPRQPQQDNIPRMTFRLHRDESAVLLPYAERLAEQGMKEFSERYRFEPKEPVIVEIYPNHDDFVVRTIGMPGVGILGAAFGYVFAMDSPSDHPDNEYHWGTTLWHELAHVFTLEATSHLIPRWFSEGISVFEEWRYGPIKGIRIPVNVYEAMAAGKFLPVADLDQGFLRPTYNEQVIVSYMQAGLVCDYINHHYGFEKIVELLAEFKQGLDTGTAIERVFGIAPAEFDRGFNDYLQNEFGDLMENLDTWKTLLRTAINKSTESDWSAVITSAREAIALFPEYVESD
ncbi:MAG: tetratricopeptide repeat protein, partial [Gammaproteobacteria bacterium]